MKARTPIELRGVDLRQRSTSQMENLSLAN
jgi:hypothetical protein